MCRCSLAQLQVLATGLDMKRQNERQFEDFLIVGEIEKSTSAREERRKWPGRASNPALAYPDLPLAGAYSGKYWLPSDVTSCFKEWTTVILDQYIPITQYVLVVTEPGETIYTANWGFLSSVEFICSKSLFDLWDQCHFTIASICVTSDCFDALDAEILLMKLRHPFNFTLQDKADGKTLEQMNELDCGMLKRWVRSGQKWRHECAWPMVYQNYARLRQEGFLDKDPPLKMSELKEIVKEKGWTWCSRPYHREL
jgi:hypothetical protein